MHVHLSKASIGAQPCAVLVACVAALAIGGCGATAERDQARFGETRWIETHPVTIVEADGVKLEPGWTLLAPGARKLTVEMPQSAGFARGERRSFELNVKPCTRYWLVATRDARTPSPYEIRVDHEQRVQACTPPRQG